MQPTVELSIQDDTGTGYQPYIRCVFGPNVTQEQRDSRPDLPSTEYPSATADTRAYARRLRRLGWSVTCAF